MDQNSGWEGGGGGTDSPLTSWNHVNGPFQEQPANPSFNERPLRHLPFATAKRSNSTAGNPAINYYLEWFRKQRKNADPSTFGHERI